MLIGLGIIVAVIYVDQGQRRVPIQYAKRVVGRKMTSGEHVPPAQGQPGGRDPIIFATSVLYFPALPASVYHAEWFQNFVTNYVQNTRSIVYMALLAMLIIFFSYFYTAIQFDHADGRQPPQERRVHPRHPARPPTADYLNRILIRIGLPGAIFLAVIALIPTIVSRSGAGSFPLEARRS